MTFRMEPRGYSAAEQHSYGSSSILLISPDDAMRRRVIDALDAQAPHVFAAEAYTHQAALSLLGQVRFDAVVVWHDPTGCDAFAVAVGARARQVSAPVLLATDPRDPETYDRAVHLVGRHRIVPVDSDPEAFVAAVTQALREVQALEGPTVRIRPTP